MRFVWLLVLFSFNVISATQVTTRIYDIDYGTSPQDETLVLLETGHVAKLRESNDLFNNKVDINLLKKKWFEISLDEERYITDLKETEAISPVVDFTGQNKKFNQYVPTTIADINTAKKYFKEARYNPKESQCFNRAMVWVYEWWRNHSLKSNKIFIFFTRNYIRRYNFEWWFHVAPLVHVMENGTVVERVMDIKYARGPQKVRDWSNLFMRNDAPCSVISKFSEYADFPYTGECYFQRANMYYYQPADLQMNEAWGYDKQNFLMNEVRGAYLEAYDETI